MPLGTEIGLGPGHIMLYGDPATPLRKGHSPRPIFGPCLFVAKRSPISATAEHLLKCKCWYVVGVTVDYSFERDCTSYVFSFWADRFFVKWFALCYRTVVLSLSNVGVLWPNGWMDPDETWHGGRPRTRPQCVRWGLSSPFQKRAQPPSQRSDIGCLPYFHTWCGLSANLECRSEMCCTRLAENTGCKKSPSGHHRTTFSGYIFATKAHIDNRKKLVKQQYLLHMLLECGELRPPSG